MKRSSPELGLLVRPYEDQDEPGVLELLQASLGGGPTAERTSEFFRWKHEANPFGRSLLLVAEAGDRIIGLRAFMRWRFRTGDRMLTAVRAVDTATHPDFQGRGVFSMLTREALETLTGEVDIVFNTPNEKSLPGYLKMGWRVVGRIPVSIRVRRPIRFLRSLGRGGATADIPEGGPTVEAEGVTDALGDGSAVDRLLREDERPTGRYTTPRTLEYLSWRYASAPHLDYRAVRLVRDGSLQGLAIFRVRRRESLWESTVAEVIAPRGDRWAASRLLRRVARAAAVDHLTCHFPRGGPAAQAARRAGFLPSGQGLTFVVNPLSDDLRPDPGEVSSWALSLGDLEVF